MEVSIPDSKERFCIECSREQSDGEIESIETLQEPVKIEIRTESRGCFGSNQRYKWKYVCTQCGEVQY